MQDQYQVWPFNLEPNLDFEYTMTLAAPRRIDNIQVGDMYQIGNFNSMLAALDSFYCDSLDPSIDPNFPNPVLGPGGYPNMTDCGTVQPPKVLSISYADSEANFPKEYLERQCFEYLKLGLMGMTVLVSSGDWGPGSGVAPGVCIDPDTGASNATSGKFSPSWPAACPWVTTVGGVQKGNGTSHEEAWSRDLMTSSGGGFSNIFEAPFYQQQKVGSYQSREQAHLGEVKAQGLFNPSGRGYPDVALPADDFLITLYKSWVTAHGTSAGPPVFASMISLINDERLHAGKKAVGFINPVLYAHADTFNDISSGHNGGCGVDTAYRATSGWDAVTGLGSPDFEKLRNVFMDLP
jgi:tripeptidyl-peptidase-1